MLGLYKEAGKQEKKKANLQERNFNNELDEATQQLFYEVFTLCSCKEAHQRFSGFSNTKRKQRFKHRDPDNQYLN